MVVIIHLLSTMDIPQNTTAFRERKYAANVEKLRWRRWEPSMLSSACPRWQGGKQNIVGGCLFFPVGGAFCYYFLRILGFWRNLGGKISCFIWQYTHIFFSTWVVKDAIHSGIRWPRFFMMLEKNWLDYKQKGAKKRRGGLQALLLLFLLVSVRALFLSALQPRRQKMTAPGWTR